MRSISQKGTEKQKVNRSRSKSPQLQFIEKAKLKGNIWKHENDLGRERVKKKNSSFN